MDRIVGLRIRCLRKIAAKTQAEFGEDLDLSQQSVSAYECGNTEVPEKVLVKISGIYGIPVEWFHGEPQNNG